MSNFLIIDDAIDLCLLLVHMLKQKEIPADCVHTLSDASAAINNKFYSIIILDNHLPDGLGIDFIECIKKDSPTSKIIMVTAYDDDIIKQKALEQGADLFISKPFTKSTVYESINALNVGTNGT